MILYGSNFDWTLVYMPELLSAGAKGFESKTSEGPISLLLKYFQNIAVIEFMTGAAKRKGSALKKVLARHGCHLVEFD